MFSENQSPIALHKLGIYCFNGTRRMYKDKIIRHNVLRDYLVVSCWA